MTVIVFIYIFCATWMWFVFLHDLAFAFNVKRDFLLYSVKVKLFFEFFVMREKANYFNVKLFSEEV